MRNRSPVYAIIIAELTSGPKTRSHIRYAIRYKVPESVLYRVGVPCHRRMVRRGKRRFVEDYDHPNDAQRRTICNMGVTSRLSSITNALRRMHRIQVSMTESGEELFCLCEPKRGGECE